MNNDFHTMYRKTLFSFKAPRHPQNPIAIVIIPIIIKEIAKRETNELIETFAASEVPSIWNRFSIRETPDLSVFSQMPTPSRRADTNLKEE